MQNLEGMWQGVVGVFKQFDSDRQIMLLTLRASKKAYPYHTTANRTLYIRLEQARYVHYINTLTTLHDTT